MTEWYRKQTWTKCDESEFFEKLRRSRKDSRAQYLLIQAIEFIQIKDDSLISVAETLLNLRLNDYPDYRIGTSQTYNSLGEIYKLRKDYLTAIEYFQKALDFENNFPNSITLAYLNYSETVILAEKTELYENVEYMLNKEIKKDTLKFPLQNYIMYSIMSVIFNYKGDLIKAKSYAELAEQNATAQSNQLWNINKNKNWNC